MRALKAWRNSAMGAGKACNAFETWRAKTAFEAWILTLRVRQFLSIYCNSRQIKALLLYWDLESQHWSKIVALGGLTELWRPGGTNQESEAWIRFFLGHFWTSVIRFDNFFFYGKLWGKICQYIPIYLRKVWQDKQSMCHRPTESASAWQRRCELSKGLLSQACLLARTV